MTDDPCIRAAELKAVRRQIAAGEQVRSKQFGEDRVEFFRADPSMLDREIRAAERECAIAEGKTPKRNRFAIRGRFRPY